ncbi:MAG: hypothetical protein M0003_11290 [Acidithiobacillus sp.]|nr:hypothetical protein [Acidithiobacillus sp.]
MSEVGVERGILRDWQWVGSAYQGLPADAELVTFSIFIYAYVLVLLAPIQAITDATARAYVLVALFTQEMNVAPLQRYCLPLCLVSGSVTMRNLRGETLHAASGCLMISEYNIRLYFTSLHCIC